jgi:hypothetical protein
LKHFFKLSYDSTVLYIFVSQPMLLTKESVFATCWQLAELCNKTFSSHVWYWMKVKSGLSHFCKKWTTAATKADVLLYEGTCPINIHMYKIYWQWKLR